jgi:hypothetical protein
VNGFGRLQSRCKQNTEAWRREPVCAFIDAWAHVPEILCSMRALLDGVFEVEEGFQEVENDEEFQYKPGNCWSFQYATLRVYF